MDKDVLDMETIGQQDDVMYNPTVQPLETTQKKGYYPVEKIPQGVDLTWMNSPERQYDKKDWYERFSAAFKNTWADFVNNEQRKNATLGALKIINGKTKEEVEYGRQMTVDALTALERLEEGLPDLSPEQMETFAAQLGAGAGSMAEFVAVSAPVAAMTGPIGEKIAEFVVTRDMVFKEGALQDIQKYIDETGDMNLENYKGSKKDVLINEANADVQGIIEVIGDSIVPLVGRMPGINKLSKPIVRKMMETWLGRALLGLGEGTVTNFLEEYTQTAPDNIAQILKDNEKLTWGKIWEGAGEAGLIGAILGGGESVVHSAAQYELGYRRTRNFIENKLVEGAKERGVEVSPDEIRTAATEITNAIESEGVQAISDSTQKILGITDSESDLAKTLSKAFQDLVNQGTVRFRGATEDEVRQAGLDWANWMQARAILDSLERGIALYEHPLNNAVAELDRIYLEGRNAGEGDLIPLDINNSQVQYLAEQIDDFIQKSQQSREQAEAARIEALREAELNARLEAVRELERNAIAELEKARQEQNEQAVANLTLDLNMLTARVDSLTSELQGLITNRQQNTGRISIKQAKGLESPRKLPTKNAVELPKNVYEKTSFKKNGNQFDVTNTGNGYLLEFKVNNKVVSAIEVGNNGMVKETFTEADERRKGYGTTLVNQAEELFGPLTVTIVPTNEEGKAFWTKLGYTNEIAPNTYSKAKPYVAKEVSPLAVLGYRWSGVRLTKDGETGHYAFRNEKAARDFVEEAKKHGYKDEDIEVVGFDETDGGVLQFQDLPAELKEQFDLAEENARLDEMYPEYTGDTIEVDGKERTVYNSEGNRIAKSKEALTNFWRWFGDSKVVDEQGRPLVVYHGSDVSGIEIFDNQANQTKQRQIGAEEGYFFTDSKKVAERFRTPEQRKAESKYYAENTIREPVTEEKYDAQGRYLGSVHYTKTTLPESKNFGLYSVYLKAESVNEYSGEDIGVGEERATALESAKQSGKDGVIIYKADTGAGIANEYIVFDSTQIKSVNNLGYYSSADDRLDYQRGFVSFEPTPVTERVYQPVMAGDRANANFWLAKQKALMDRAKEFYGTTDNIDESGYILPDGSLLDMSGANLGGSHTGRRVVDHRDISDAFEEESTEYPEGVGWIDFINAGAIRFQPESMDFGMAHIPTPEQIKTIERILLYNAQQVPLFQKEPGIQFLSDANKINESQDTFFQKVDVNTGAEQIKRLATAFFGGSGITPIMLDRMSFQNKKTSASKTGLGKEYRGAYDPLTRAILFSKVSDVTTLFHESAHYWFDRNLRYYKTGMASPEWKDRWEKVMEELGVVPNARGYVTAASVKAGSEKFARSMEAYLKTGEYENAAMQWAHQDYKNMVGRVYRNLWKNYWGLEDLSPAVKDWFNMNGFDVSNPMTAFAEKTTMDTAEEDIGNIVATDETKPDVPAVVQEEADAANGQVVENRKGEVAIVPEDEYETDKRVHSKLPESAERATGVEMEPIVFNRRSMSDSLRAARDLVDRDPVRAWEALRAGDDMIDGLYAGDIYRALISKYKEENNPTMIKTVVQSFANAARRAGRSVKAFDLETPTVSYEGTISSLNKVFATKSNDAKVNELVKQIKNFLHDPEALNKGWEKFKEELECK